MVADGDQVVVVAVVAGAVVDSLSLKPRNSLDSTDVRKPQFSRLGPSPTLNRSWPMPLNCILLVIVRLFVILFT